MPDHASASCFAEDVVSAVRPALAWLVGMHKYALDVRRQRQLMSLHFYFAANVMVQQRADEALLHLFASIALARALTAGRVVDHECFSTIAGACLILEQIPRGISGREPPDERLAIAAMKLAQDSRLYLQEYKGEVHQDVTNLIHACGALLNRKLAQILR